MATERLTRYEPNYGTKPGEVLQEYLTARGMTKAELAARCGRPVKTISEIIHGKAAITPETALQLERVLGRPAVLWQNLEGNYRLYLAQVGERDSFSDRVGWARKFPIETLVERGAIEEPEGNADLVTKLLRFFGVGTIAGWEASFGRSGIAYRRSAAYTATLESVASWLRLGEIEAEQIDCEPFSVSRFKATLSKVRELTAQSVPTAQRNLIKMCASAGVAVAFVPELPKTHLSGIARWLSKDKALIQLSLRHKTNDHFWFSFFHEAGHLLLHGKKTVFIDEDGMDVNEVEQQANRFASDFLIPPAAFDRFRRAANFSSTAVKKFAGLQGIAPGIVVGRLQHDRLIPYAMHNALKERLAWA